jgi:hypothetical protein
MLTVYGFASKNEENGNVLFRNDEFTRFNANELMGAQQTRAEKRKHKKGLRQKTVNKYIEYGDNGIEAELDFMFPLDTISINVNFDWGIDNWDEAPLEPILDPSVVELDWEMFPNV